MAGDVQHVLKLYKELIDTGFIVRNTQKRIHEQLIKLIEMTNLLFKYSLIHF